MLLATTIHSILIRLSTAYPRYDWMQCIGALVIMSGVFVVLSPKFFSASSVSGGTDLLIFNVIFFLANIPQSLSSVYKEVAFKDTVGSAPTPVFHRVRTCSECPEEQF